MEYSLQNVAARDIRGITSDVEVPSTHLSSGEAALNDMARRKASAFATETATVDKPLASEDHIL